MSEWCHQKYVLLHLWVTSLCHCRWAIPQCQLRQGKPVELCQIFRTTVQFPFRLLRNPGCRIKETLPNSPFRVLQRRIWQVRKQETSIVFFPFQMTHFANYGYSNRPTLNEFAYCHFTSTGSFCSIFDDILFTPGRSYNSTCQHLHKDEHSFSPYYGQSCDRL